MQGRLKKYQKKLYVVIIKYSTFFIKKVEAHSKCKHRGRNDKKYWDFEGQLPVWKQHSI